MSRNRFINRSKRRFYFTRWLSMVRATSKMASRFASTAQHEIPPNFFDCIKPIRKAARLFGLLSFTVNYAPNGTIESCQLRAFDIIYAAFHIAVCSVTFVLICVYFSFSDNVWDMVILSGMEFFIVSALFIAAVSIALDIFNRNRLIEMLQKIHQFDTTVSKLKQAKTTLLNERTPLSDQRFRRASKLQQWKTICYQIHTQHIVKQSTDMDNHVLHIFISQNVFVHVERSGPFWGKLYCAQHNIHGVQRIWTCTAMHSKSH